MDPQLRSIESALDARFVTVEDAPWGSKNRTVVVRLANGDEGVLQRYSDRSAAHLRVNATEQLSRPLKQHGISAPLVIHSDLDSTPPWAMFERMKGEVAYVAAGDDLGSASFPHIAMGMGQVLRALHQLDPRNFDLPDLWAEPLTLQSAACTWLLNLEPYLSAEALRATRRVLDAVPELLLDRPIAVAHGDFGPQNVLVRDDRISAVLDFEDARLADPLADVAWWAWLVRAHTPRAFLRSWRSFVDASAVDPSESRFDERIFTLIVLRLLETAEAFRNTRPQKYPSWAIRLASTLGWRGLRFHDVLQAV